MREYKFKRGFKATNERLEEMLRKYFGNFEVDGDSYVVRNFGALEELRTKLSNGKLIVSSKSKPVDNELAYQTIKTYNKFLEELTGYTAKERQKLLRKEVEGE